MRKNSHCRAYVGYKIYKTFLKNASKHFATFATSSTTCSLPFIMKIATINPYTNQVEARFTQHRWRQIDQILRQAEAGFAVNRNSAMPLRSKRLNALADLLDARKQDYAQLITLEMGKPISESIAEIEKCAWVCRYYAENAKHFLRDDMLKTDYNLSLITHQPLGVVLAIMPWNFPFWQVFRFAAAAIMAGNAVVLKHAPNVPQCAAALEQLFTDAHFPDGLFQNIYLENSKVHWLIEEARIQAITFTGSAATGAKVAEMAGRHLKKMVLELGGSDPFIVLDDAPLRDAAYVGTQSRMLNAGQSCIAAKRFIVTEAIAPNFLRLMAQEIQALRVGDPQDPNTQIGPLARPDLVLNLERQVRESLRLGAQIVVGGSRQMNHVGNYYYPTLLTNCKRGMPVFDEETFGPVAAVAVVKNLQEAIALANDTPYGLGASVWTNDTDRAMRIALQIQSGFVSINGMVKSDPRLPFGGIKQSGYGRELGEYGIREFVNTKTIVRP